ncbi:endothelial cell-specific chemotaxis regulator-like isoform X1 [Heptranchias perlo]|uniref:endothelial cell-specific chemotaxis regulator-like isoform X1 n=1 Tax=Heptranchias perlo TaxID=212740 RepID=UPI00355A9965
MATLKVTVFLLFSLFHILKGTIVNDSTNSVATTQTNPTTPTGTMNNGETTAVTTGYPNWSVTSGKTASQDAGRQQSTVTASEANVATNSSSVTGTFTITPSAGSENSTSEVTSLARNETIVNTSAADKPPSRIVTSTVQSTYLITSSNKTEATDSTSGVGPTTVSATGSTSLSVLAFAVIILILILVIVVVILVSVISLRFKCCDCQDASQDKRKKRNAAPSESSQANGEKESITLVSMRTLSTEAGGQESSVQGSLQNDSIEAGETDKHFQQIDNTKLV